MATILVAPAPSRSVRDRRWSTLRRAARARLAPFGAAVLLLAIAVALLAPVVAPYNPLKQNLNNTLARPDWTHLLGTDNVGRDVFSRVIYGTRVSLVAGFGSVVIAVLVGGLLGLLAGYAGGRVDNTPTFARLMRGQVLSITAREYVDAARALGAPGWRIAWSHVLPNATAPIVVQASLSVAFAILAEASLSFLGLGIQPPAASWGSMINAGRGYLQQAPWIVFGPGAALFITVVGLNFVGDAIRDALDPRLRA
jgi:peptide/nickel transport system permease protein